MLGIRPEGLEDAALIDGDRRPRLRGQVQLREALGPEVLMHFSVTARHAVTEEVRELAEDAGSDRIPEPPASDGPPAATLVGRLSPLTKIREGDLIEVAIDERSLHFFDAETGLAIY